MGIDNESDRGANLVIGPTSLGMVRIYIESDELELPMDFDPDAAREIAGELQAAADRAEGMSASSTKTENGAGPGRQRSRKKQRHRGGGGG